MKIRTDFVTNSSSSSYITISIKNPKLAQIICKAKKYNEAEKPNPIEIDEAEQIIKLELGGRDFTKYEPNMPEDMATIYDMPKNLSNLYKSLFKKLREYEPENLCKALERNSEYIIASTESADWTYHVEGYGEAALFDWYWELVDYIVQKEHLDYKPSSVGLGRHFHFDKEDRNPYVTHWEGFSYDEEDAYDYDDYEYEYDEDLEFEEELTKEEQ